MLWVLGGLGELDIRVTSNLHMRFVWCAVDRRRVEKPDQQPHNTTSCHSATHSVAVQVECCVLVRGQPLQQC